MTAAHLTALDRRVYAGISRFAFGEAVAWPSQDRVADDLGVTREAVNRSVRRLRLAGWLEVEKVRQEGARWLHNAYELLAPFAVASSAAKAITRAAHRRARSVVEKVRRARFGEADHTNYVERFCGCSSCRPERRSAMDAERFIASHRAGLELRERERLRPSLLDPRLPA